MKTHRTVAKFVAGGFVLLVVLFGASLMIIFTFATWIFFYQN